MYVPLWLGLVDFEKAFDTVDHTMLWKVLREQGAPGQYVQVLQAVYEAQTSIVQTDICSRNFPVTRGVRQGDPISALLFIAVLQSCVGTLQKKWEGMSLKRSGALVGLALGASDRQLTNLRFADDIILVAQSRRDIKMMLGHLAQQSSHYGLRMHFGKTKVMTWNSLSKGNLLIPIGDRTVDIIDEMVAEKYLGCSVSLGGGQQVELNNRISASWASFHKHKEELCNKRYRKSDRMRLFNAVVTPTLLYGCGAWTLTQAQEQSLKALQRKMLRYVLRVFRRKTSTGEMEEWAEYLKRSAETVDEERRQHDMEEWSSLSRRRKWQFAGKTARQKDNRWSKLILDWQPDFGLGRFQGRPKKRWSDDIVAYVGGNWIELANDVNLWSSLEDGYVLRLW